MFKIYKLQTCVPASSSKKYLNSLRLKCTSVFWSRMSFGSKFQSLAAENLNDVWPHFVLTWGKSTKVETLRDRQCRSDRFTKYPINCLGQFTLIINNLIYIL